MTLNKNTLNLFEDGIKEEIEESKTGDLPLHKGTKSKFEIVDITTLKEHPRNSLIYLLEEDQLQLDQMKESILHNGLIQPLVCKKENGHNILIIGHQRTRALKELVKEGHVAFQFVEVMFAQYETEADEMEALLDSNVASRKVSEYSKMMQVAAYQKNFLERIENKQLDGISIEKEYIAKKMRIGQRQASKYLYIRKNIDNSLLKELLNNQYSLNKIYDLMKEYDDNFEAQFQSKIGTRSNEKKEVQAPKLSQSQQQKLKSLVLFGKRGLDYQISLNEE